MAESSESRRGARPLALAAALLLMGMAAAAQQRITNICIVDSARIHQVFFRQSRRAQEYQALVEETRQAIKQMNAQIDELKVQRIEAVRVGNDEETARLDRRIQELTDNRDAYWAIRSDQQQRLFDDLTSNDKYFRDLHDAVAWVCQHEGYAIALDPGESPILWWDPQIDITEKVIARLTSR